MGFEIKGIIHDIFEEQQVTQSFRKREFALEIADGSYMEYPMFQATQDRCLLLDGFRKGDEVVVHFNLKGRPYTRKDGTTTYFTNLNVWKIERSAEVMEQPAAPPHSEADVPPPALSNDMPVDDLPF